MSELLLGNSLKFGVADTPTREGEVVQKFEDIYNILTPVVGMSVFVRETKKSYIVKSLKKENVGGKEVYTKVDEVVCIEEQIEALETENVGRDVEINSNKVKVNALTNSLNSEIARAQEAEAALNDLINGGEGSNAKYSTRFIGVFNNFSDLLAGIDSLIYDKSQEDKNLGSFRALLAQRIVEIKNVSLVRSGSSLVQVVSGPFEESNGSLSISSIEYGIFSRIHDNTWSKWKRLTTTMGEVNAAISTAIAALIDKAPENLDTLKEIADWIEEHGNKAADMLLGIQQNTNEITTIKGSAVSTNSFNVQPDADKIEIGYNSINGEPYAIHIQSATPTKAGAMSAEDKAKLNASIKNVDIAPSPNDVELDLEDNTDKVTHVVFPAATTETAGVMSAEDKVSLDSIPNVIEKIKDGDTIVGQAREIHSRNGKTITDSFLSRTTAGSGTIGDGVATLKSVGGNIVKNLVDGTFGGSYIHKDIRTSPAYPQLFYLASDYNFILNHVYYFSAVVKTDANGSDERIVCITVNGGGNIRYSYGTKDMWHNISIVNKYNIQGRDMFVRGLIATYIYVIKPLLIDLTEMFGAGNEPTQAECDKLFGTMDALPQGLSIAKPTEFKSTGFNQFNPDNVLDGKAIVDNAIVSGDKKIAVIPCLPCKVGVGENNGYCIHGDFGEDIKVYLTPLNPMEVDGELYMHELTKDTTTDTYVPLIKGYMLVEVPTTANLCAHFLWSEDKCERDTYEPYHESKIELPTIPQMSEWGLAGIQSSGTLVCDEIDFERGVYIKRIGSVDLGSLPFTYYKSGDGTAGFKTGFSTVDYGFDKTGNLVCAKFGLSPKTSIFDSTWFDESIMYYPPNIYIRTDDYTTAASFKAAMQGVILYYELAEPEEYPLPKVDNNYTSSDYGVEQFDSVVPCSANNLYYMRSLAGETRNFLDRMYANTGKEESPIAVADYITNGIEGNKELATNAPNLALRALFVAAGAEYNDTDKIIQKTAPWGETVQHLPKRYYLNGLGDITEEQMIDIYNAGKIESLNMASRYNMTNIRTNLPTTIAISGAEGFGQYNLSGVCSNSRQLQVILLNNGSILHVSDNIYGSFSSCLNLEYIYPTLNVINCTSAIKLEAFYACKKLKHIELKDVKANLKLPYSSNISKSSILYIIQNATPTSAITITLHADAYARLANDADIVAALEAQPLVTLVSA